MRASSSSRSSASTRLPAASAAASSSALRRSAASASAARRSASSARRSALRRAAALRGPPRRSRACRPPPRPRGRVRLSVRDLGLGLRGARAPSSSARPASDARRLLAQLRDLGVAAPVGARARRRAPRAPPRARARGGPSPAGAARRPERRRPRGSGSSSSSREPRGARRRSARIVGRGRCRPRTPARIEVGPAERAEQRRPPRRRAGPAGSRRAPSGDRGGGVELVQTGPLAVEREVERRARVVAGAAAGEAVEGVVEQPRDPRRRRRSRPRRRPGAPGGRAREIADGLAGERLEPHLLLERDELLVVVRRRRRRGRARARDPSIRAGSTSTSAAGPPVGQADRLASASTSAAGAYGFRRYSSARTFRVRCFSKVSGGRLRAREHERDGLQRVVLPELLADEVAAHAGQLDAEHHRRPAPTRGRGRGPPCRRRVTRTSKPRLSSAPRDLAPRRPRRSR